MIRPRGVGGRNGGDAPCPHPQPLQLHLFASSGLPGCLSVCLFGEQRFSPPHVTGSRATHTHTHTTKGFCRTSRAPNVRRLLLTPITPRLTAAQDANAPRRRPRSLARGAFTEDGFPATEVYTERVGY